MGYLVKTNHYKTGRVQHLASFKKAYATIPEIMLSQYKVPLTRKIWVLATHRKPNGWRTPFVCVFKGTLLEWFQKYFVPNFKYNDQWYYLGMRRGAKIQRGYSKSGKYKYADPIEQRESNLHYEEKEPQLIEPHKFNAVDYIIAEDEIDQQRYKEYEKRTEKKPRTKTLFDLGY